MSQTVVRRHESVTGRGIKTGHRLHPKGLYILFATEMWERFGFYTTAAVMTLYLQDGGLRLVQDPGDRVSGRTT